MKTPSLYLIPVTLGDTPLDNVLPEYNKNIIKEIQYFIVENIRTTRRFLKQVDKNIDIDVLHFFELNKHTNANEINTYLEPMKQGYDVGVISEAGCPAIADPGSDIVAIAQRLDYSVVPLVGPSSILMSLMASGFNGQQFTFNGYLPIDDKERKNKLSSIESRILKSDETQIFIETPFRNIKLVEDILKQCSSQLKLCIACNITCPDEYIKTKTLKEWTGKLPDLHKKTCIFLLYK